MESSGAGDRLSKLEDHVLGHILSFLPAKEAARAAALSPRWRNLYDHVHTVSMEEEPADDTPGDGYRNACDSPQCYAPRRDLNRKPRFSTGVSAALLARHHRGGAVPLRALRVAMADYRHASDCSAIDQWVTYAVRQAVVEIELRFRRILVCARPYYHCSGTATQTCCQEEGEEEEEEEQAPPPHCSVSDNNMMPMPDDDMVEDDPHRSIASLSDDEDVLFSSDDVVQEKDPYLDHHHHRSKPAPHTITTALFSCATLRSLSLVSCLLAPPATIHLPSLETLLLSFVPDPGSHVQRLVSGCPRLADLTLEQCHAVTSLSVLGNETRLRRLAIRCCHNLKAVVLSYASELRAFEYKGCMPDESFLTMHGGCTRISVLKVDICGWEVIPEHDFIKLSKLLQQFANAKYIRLESARLGSGAENDVTTVRFPTLPRLRCIELGGCLPDNDDTGAVDMVSTILQYTPDLETLTLVFYPHKQNWDSTSTEEDPRDAHHLSYNPHAVLHAPNAVMPCLRSRLRKIGLVYYQGGTAQRTLVKFLLINAPLIQELWCYMAEGPLWRQTQLMREIKGWITNKSATTYFA
ncbi:hypothetical protein QOZ80_5BG0423540 [Eleusine coracana subsp. coracana]|nr:hypothetical protein QOZ80_5BG0423540 [Eleusine coracana subsp. coracana]